MSISSSIDADEGQRLSGAARRERHRNAPARQRIREILRGAFREVRTLVAASEPAESVALINVHLVRLFPQRGSADVMNG
jgi:hypothetical protein